jgi:hypothetical protein
MRWPPPRTQKLPVTLKDGQVHCVRIVFQPPILSVHLDGNEVLTSVVELATVVDEQGAAYTPGMVLSGQICFGPHRGVFEPGDVDCATAGTLFRFASPPAPMLL